MFSSKSAHTFIFINVDYRNVSIGSHLEPTLQMAIVSNATGEGTRLTGRREGGVERGKDPCIRRQTQKCLW